MSLQKFLTAFKHADTAEPDIDYFLEALGDLCRENELNPSYLIPHIAFLAEVKPEWRKASEDFDSPDALVKHREELNVDKLLQKKIKEEGYEDWADVLEQLDEARERDEIVQALKEEHRHQLKLLGATMTRARNKIDKLIEDNATDQISQS